MSRRILVIDDEEAIRIIIQASLEFTARWTVFLAASATEGIKIARTERPDAILLDVMMPEMDGISLLHQLRSHPTTQDIPAIFLTAQAQETERKKLEKLSSGVISKPFEPTAIARQISSLLNWPD
jgi:two-component system, OmpR family, alkaline phosphatase synthesis response regulator PhoP